MALIKCKECGTEVSDKAVACPKCAVPINPPKPAKKGMGCLSWIILAFFTLVVIVMVSNSVQETTSPRSTGGTTPAPEQKPELLMVSFSCTENTAASIAQGRVRNIGARRLDSVRVVASFYTKDNTQLGSDFSYLEVDGLLPGQESPFRVHGPKNPAYARCSVDAFMQGLLGGQLRWTSNEK